MEFFEFIFIFSVAFVLPLTIIKMSLDYKKARLRAGDGEGAGIGVTAGDLKRLLRDAVEEANAPLLARIDDLDARLQPGRFVEAFDEERVEGEAEPQERTLGRRVAE